MTPQSELLIRLCFLLAERARNFLFGSPYLDRHVVLQPEVERFWVSNESPYFTHFNPKISASNSLYTLEATEENVPNFGVQIRFVCFYLFCCCCCCCCCCFVCFFVVTVVVVVVFFLFCFVFFFFVFLPKRNIRSQCVLEVEVNQLRVKIAQNVS